MFDELAPRVIQVIAQEKHIAADTITVDSTFEELGIDSLDGIQILFGLENEFDISIPDDAARSLRSVRDMVAGVQQLVAAKAAAAQS